MYRAGVVDVKRKSTAFCPWLECRGEGGNQPGPCRRRQLSRMAEGQVAGPGFLPLGSCSPGPRLLPGSGPLLERKIDFCLLETLLFGVSVTALKHMGEVRGHTDTFGGRVRIGGHSKKRQKEQHRLSPICWVPC